MHPPPPEDRDHWIAKFSLGEMVIYSWSVVIMIVLGFWWLAS